MVTAHHAGAIWTLYHVPCTIPPGCKPQVPVHALPRSHPEALSKSLLRNLLAASVCLQHKLASGERFSSSMTQKARRQETRSFQITFQRLDDELFAGRLQFRLRSIGNRLQGRHIQEGLQDNTVRLLTCYTAHGVRIGAL